MHYFLNIVSWLRLRNICIVLRTSIPDFFLWIISTCAQNDWRVFPGSQKYSNLIILTRVKSAWSLSSQCVKTYFQAIRLCDDFFHVYLLHSSCSEEMTVSVLQLAASHRNMLIIIWKASNSSYTTACLFGFLH